MSERTLDAALTTSLESAVARYVLLVSLDFPSGFVRVHNSIGTFSFGGNNYLGVGSLGDIELMEETTDMVTPGVKLLLSSITNEIISAIRTDNIFNRAALVYMCALTPGGQLDGTPDLWIRGKMVRKELVVGGDSVIALSVETSGTVMKRVNNKRFTLEDHQALYSTDLFFEFLPYVQDATPIWFGEVVRFGFKNNNDGLIPTSGSRRPGGRSGAG